MDNFKILLIVEGVKAEKDFVERLTKLYNIKCQIYTVGTNLFALYDKIKQADFPLITDAVF